MTTATVLKLLGYAVLVFGGVGGLLWLLLGTRAVSVTLPGWLLPLALAAGSVITCAVLVGFGRNLELLEEMVRNARR